eukprot:7143685-Heterocapsa_arctica.AAC.1
MSGCPPRAQMRMLPMPSERPSRSLGPSLRLRPRMPSCSSRSSAARARCRRRPSGSAAWLSPLIIVLTVTSS